jgi:hypothetical protein
MYFLMIALIHPMSSIVTSINWCLCPLWCLTTRIFPAISSTSLGSDTTLWIKVFGGACTPGSSRKKVYPYSVGGINGPGATLNVLRMREVATTNLSWHPRQFTQCRTSSWLRCVSFGIPTRRGTDTRYGAVALVAYRIPVYLTL